MKYILWQMLQSRVIHIGSFSEPYCTAKELQREAKVTPKTFAHLRDTLGLVPKPIKTSSGLGVVGFYPKVVAAHLNKIEALHKKGRSYPQIAVELKEETERLLEQCDELRRSYEFERGVRRRMGRSLVVSSHPAFVFQPATSDTTVVTEKKLGDLKRRLKDAFRRWDGASVGALKRIRGLIDRVQEAETAQRLIAQTKGNSA